MLVSAENNVADLRYLLEKGANPNAQDSEGETALMIAARLANLDAARLLMRYGADPRLVSKSGKTAADLAGERGRNALIDLLERSASMQE